jgi:hypothetical protein
MPTLAEVRDAVDARLADLWTNQIVPRQNTYASNHGGRYWQGIITTNLAAMPDNLTTGSILEVVPDTTRKPTDQAESWAAASINLGATIPMALEIHAYDGPSGKGYVGIVWAKWTGTWYRRSQAFGPETWRTVAWAAVVLT